MSKKVKRHDPLVRQFLSDLSVAREFLEIYLPENIKSKCDLNSLTIEPGSYIEPDLKTHCSDIVYKAKLYPNEPAKFAYIYTLIEHQSHPEILMPYRILNYQSAIIRNHLDKLDKLPKNASPVRLRNRCALTGRPRGFIRKFGISRIKFRDMALEGRIPGVKKASW